MDECCSIFVRRLSHLRQVVFGTKTDHASGLSYLWPIQTWSHDSTPTGRSMSIRWNEPEGMRIEGWSGTGLMRACVRACKPDAGLPQDGG